MRYSRRGTGTLSLPPASTRIPRVQSVARTPSFTTPGEIPLYRSDFTSKNHILSKPVTPDTGRTDPDIISVHFFRYEAFQEILKILNTPEPVQHPAGD